MIPFGEIWHVLLFKGEKGQPLGFYQFFHPNEAAAVAKAAELNADPDMRRQGITAAAFRYAHDVKVPPLTG